MSVWNLYCAEAEQIGISYILPVQCGELNMQCVSANQMFASIGAYPSPINIFPPICFNLSISLGLWGDHDGAIPTRCPPLPCTLRVCTWWGFTKMVISVFGGSRKLFSLMLLEFCTWWRMLFPQHLLGAGPYIYIYMTIRAIYMNSTQLNGTLLQHRCAKIRQISLNQWSK